MSKIQSTKDYSMFKKHENNREIDRLNLRKITASIQSQNMLEFRPILVDKDMRIIDGQHRLEAAKNLGIEVFYQINETASHCDIAILNTNTKQWVTNDYVNYYASLGKQGYINLKRNCEEQKVSPSAFVQLMKGDRRAHTRKIKNGTFELEQTDVDYFKLKLDTANDVINTIKTYLINEPMFLKSHRMQKALFQFLKNPEVDVEIFKKKISYKADAIRPCAESGAYYAMFRDIYNWRNPKPLGKEILEEEEDRQLSLI